MQSLQKHPPYPVEKIGRSASSSSTPATPASIWMRMIAFRYSRQTGLLRSIRYA